MKNTEKKKRSSADKVALFRACFLGLSSVYGTYDPNTGRAWQVKEPVTNDVILSHLKGERPYGVYLLDGDRIRAIAADFDDADPFPPVELLNAAEHYELPAYIESSKSKGFHVWIFFDHKGVKASKARVVIKNILEEIEYPQTEIFPKQDRIDKLTSFGNFINAPLFGRLVQNGKTVFLDPYTLKPHSDQWAFLESVKCVDEHLLDQIIKINDLNFLPDEPKVTKQGFDSKPLNQFGLPVCAKKMFEEGVSQFQRVSCFRLAVHLKRLGLPFEIATAALETWALKNRPEGEGTIITKLEIMEQVKYAFSKDYRSYGCDSEAVFLFCQSDCRLYKAQITHHEINRS